MPLHISFVLEQRTKTLQEALKEALFRKGVSKFPLLKYPFCDARFQLSQKLNYTQNYIILKGEKNGWSFSHYDRFTAID
jgi:hypothetical protein